VELQAAIWLLALASDISASFIIYILICIINLLSDKYYVQRTAVLSINISLDSFYSDGMWNGFLAHREKVSAWIYVTVNQVLKWIIWVIIHAVLALPC